MTNRYYHGTRTELTLRDLIAPADPLRITGEITDWQGHAPEAIQAMKDRLGRLEQLGVEAIDD